MKASSGPAGAIAVGAASHAEHAQPRARGRDGALARALWAFRRELAWVFVFGAFANLLMLTPTVYMLQLFDRVMASGNDFTLLTVTALMLGFVATMAFAEWLRSRLMVRLGTRLDDALGRRVFLAAFRAQLQQPQRSPQQPLADLNSVRQFLTGNGMFAIADTPWAPVFIAVLYLMHPWLGSLAVAFCVLQLALALLARHVANRRQRDVSAAENEATQYLQAKLRNVDTVAAMGMQPPLRRHWLDRHGSHVQRLAAMHEASARIQALTKWLQYTQQALMLSLGALLAIDGQITAGAMIASNALMGNALRPFGLLVQVWTQAVDARAAWVRLDRLLGSAEQVQVEAAPPALTGQLSLRRVTVRVEGREAPILDAVDADFRAGEVVAIVGPSGAGKSTLVRCMLGIWPGHEGHVLLDGHDLRALPRDAIGPQLGYLPQDIELFDGTIAQNIARFDDAEPQAIVEAARMAGIHEMVLRMPKGYDTSIGAGGMVLSGGQQQRLALARALMGEPRIAVLDEPNANLDEAGEAALVAAIEALRQRGATVFMIVHRQHLLKLADRLLVLDRGRVAALTEINRARMASVKEDPR
ncbi:MAG: type I secretion system permease/ATPase [Burkholderiales bacterium]|nr:type I secretion system permease/ATPase [Burkholderiales bacterium]